VLSAENQLRSIEAKLLATGGTPRSEGRILVLPGDGEGSLRLDLVYPSGHLLSAQVAIDTRHGYPNWTRYSFHVQDKTDACVFRYDNVDHHDRVETFPDHKHVGPAEAVEGHFRPTLRHIINEVLAVTG